MVQGYYTLEEAAQILGLTTEELKQLSKQGELRAFQDRGTLRFRTQEVMELARQRGARSDVELPLGEAPRSKPADSPPPRTPSKKPDDVFGFSLETGDEQVQIGQEIYGESPSKRRSDSKKGTPPTPTPKPGSDSDVRLVSDGSDLDFHIASDSDVKLVDDAGPKSSGPKSGPKSGLPKSPPPRRAETALGPEEQKKSTPPGQRRKSGAHLDSGPRLVGIDSDSDVKIVGVDSDEVQVGKMAGKSGTDSDIRLDFKGSDSKANKGSHANLLTEEIDLDAEIRKAEEAARAKAKGKSDPHAKALPQSKPPIFPDTSPFELSEDDVGGKLKREPAKTPEVKKKRSPDSSGELQTPRSVESSSDFDLTPAVDDSSPLELGSDEFQLEVGDDSEVGLGDLPAGKEATSGINLKDPADSGISLEQGGEGSDEIEFELSLDAEATPKPAPAVDSDSDSEFELTIDETGGLAPLEEEAPAAGEEEKDIFETDFDVPALEDESGSQAVALDESDTDLDSSDFDIALSDADMAIEDESGSQVVALEDEEEADDAAATIQHPKKKGTLLLEEDEAALEDVEEGGGIDELLTGEEQPQAEVEEEEEEPAAPVGAALAIPAAEWGPVPVIFLVPCVAVLLLVAMMGFELLQGVMGYNKPGPVTEKVAKIFGAPLPKN
jgi:excisionase family DNA binding protein